MTHQNSTVPLHPYSDEALIHHLPGFTNHYATVNGVRLHYVEGGAGQPLICLPGWPQTWYSYRSVAGELAKHYRLLIVDIRGMGSSDKPQSGYDKKTMASDIKALLQHLELTSVYLMGHDIGGMVAMSFAFNYPQLTQKLVVLDGSHPSEGMLQMSLIPPIGTFGEKMDANRPYAWWMGFNQVKGLPEQLLAGRFQYLLDWLFHYVMIDDTKMTSLEREIYAASYNDAESIRAANAWYQTFTQDIVDAQTYPLLDMPVLGIGSYVSYQYMKMGMPYVAKDAEMVGILDSGHYLFEEKPDQVLETILKFLA